MFFEVVVDVVVECEELEVSNLRLVNLLFIEDILLCNSFIVEIISYIVCSSEIIFKELVLIDFYFDIEGNEDD